MHLALNYTHKKTGIAITSLFMLLMIVFLFSLTIGAVPISVVQVISIIGNSVGLDLTSVTDIEKTVFLNIRLPRLVQTITIGAALGLSGASLQGLFRNPLVEPGLVGVSSGAALAAVIFIVFGGSLVSHISPNLNQYLLPFVAFSGGLVATLLVYRLSQSFGRTHISLLLLAGIAVISLSQAFIGFSIFYASENQARAFSFWTLGDLGGATWSKILITTPLVVVPSLFLLTFSRSLNAMAVGETDAYYMGVNVERMKIIIIICCALAVGAVVSLAGTISFVGLIVPHMIRMTFGSDHRLVLPGSALGGAILLIVSDVIARTVVQPAELPIGIVTAIIGTPFLIYLIRKAKSQFQL